MVPESISASQDATPGEKLVFKVLRDALLPDEEFIVWFEPAAVKRRPDFLVWSQELGLLVIEVKDWDSKKILDMNPRHWKIERHGKPQVHDSPTEQARKVFIGFKELFQRSGLFCHPEGPNAGRLRFPIGYCAVFTNITRKQAKEKGITAVLRDSLCLFSEDLQFECEDRGAQRKFISRLRQCFDVQFHFDPLTYKELKLLRYTIFPEIRIEGIRKLRSHDDYSMVKTLDLAQERTAKSIPSGHRVLKGVAGSGKTLVLTCRAKYLSKLHPNWKILIVCFNLSLCRYLLQLIQADGECDSPNIQVSHYHGLVKSLTHASLARLSGEDGDAYDFRVGELLRHALARGEVKQRFDAILIDEGQDFAGEWVHSLTELLDGEADSFLLCLDPAQNIFGRKMTFKSVGMKVGGKRPILLKTSYRNTVEILELARSFAGVLPASANQNESIDEALFPMSVDRHGPPPVIRADMPARVQVDFVLEQIDKHIRSGDCSWTDIGVLYTAAGYPGFLLQFRDAFVARFGEDKLFWVSKNRESKMALDLTTESVKLSTINSAKGLEFRVVFLIGLEILPREGRVANEERRLAYVGLTRAQDFLYVLGCDRCGLLGDLLSLMSQPPNTLDTPPAFDPKI